MNNKMLNVSLVVIGAGPAGMAAALKCREQGIKDILILERNDTPGGILKQCIHSGFGLLKFDRELTGPEYADIYEKEIRRQGITVLCGTMVTDITPQKEITAVSKSNGLMHIKAQAVILAMGCRERSRGGIGIPGSRPAGICTAGTAQYLVNRKGMMPGKRVVILGSGDIGLIMARRMVLEGAEVEAVIERMPYSMGLKRNIVQCLEDYNIPLYLNHNITEIHGKDRITGITMAGLDYQQQPVPGTEREIACDTLLLSVGLIPENELSRKAGIVLNKVTHGAEVDENRETMVDGIFACGNVLHVHDIVDFVSDEAETAGMGAALYLKGLLPQRNSIRILPGKGVSYVVPQRLTGLNNSADVKLYFRPSEEIRGAEVTVSLRDKSIKHVSRRIVTPGQMETITLTKADLAGITGDIVIEAGSKK